MFNISNPVPERVSNWSILVKPTHACNLNCQYCYDKPFRDKYGGKVMSFEMIDHILKITSQYTDEVQWIWHGGEPTVLGVDWYIKAQELFYKYPNLKVKQNMQSNGILLDEKWAEFANKYEVSIGVSYDAFSQDIRLNGKTIKVEDSLDKFREAGGRFGVITVINKTNYKQMKEMYDYFKSRKIAPSFNHVYRSSGTVAFDLEMTPEEYAVEFKDFFEYWMKDNDSTSVHERTNSLILSKVTGSEKERLCTYSDCRFGWIGINPAGEVYPCDRFVPEQYNMGNIMDFDSIPDLYNKANGHKLYSLEIQKRLMTHCQDCGYIDYCQGGCNANHIAVAGDASGVDEFSCELFRQEFNGLYDLLREIDIYAPNQKWNHNFAQRTLLDPFFFVKEIKDFLRTKGISEHLLEWEYKPNGKELLTCQEYRIYRIFNPFKGTNANTGHSNFTNPATNINVDIKPDFDFSEVMVNRQEVLDKLWEDNQNHILYLLLEEKKNGK